MREQLNKILDLLIGTWGGILGIALILLGVWLQDGSIQAQAGVQHLFGSFARELGVALLVVVFITFTLDRRQKQLAAEESKNTLLQFDARVDGFISSLKKNLFSALYNWQIPPSFLQEFQRQILAEGKTRDRCLLEYTLRELTLEERTMLEQEDPGCRGPNRMVLEVKFSNRMQNKRSEKIQHEICCYTEKENAPNFNRHRGVTITWPDGTTLSHSDDKLKECRLDGGGCEADLNTIYKLPPATIDANSFVDIEYRAICIRDKRHTREVFTSIILTEDLKVVVKNHIPDLEIMAEALAPQAIKKNVNGNEHTYVLSRPLLPYQGVMVWWHNPNL
jgi:hypothetical protein